MGILLLRDYELQEVKRKAPLNWGAYSVGTYVTLPNGQYTQVSKRGKKITP